MTLTTETSLIWGCARGRRKLLSDGAAANPQRAKVSRPSGQWRDDDRSATSARDAGRADRHRRRAEPRGAPASARGAGRGVDLPADASAGGRALRRPRPRPRRAERPGGVGIGFAGAGAARRREPRLAPSGVVRPLSVPPPLNRPAARLT